MRSDHLSKHIKTHLNKKAAAASGPAPADSSAPAPLADAPTEPHTLVTMETLTAESIARLAGSGINVMQMGDLHQINSNG